MSNIPDRENRIERVRQDINLRTLYAQYWMAQATTGIAALRDMKRGREPTPEETANGVIIGWTPLTDQEKIADALQTAESHIDSVRVLGDVLSALLTDDLDSYNFAIRMR